MNRAINIQGRLYDFDTPKVMSIINLTPDSFYAPSRFRIKVEEGADILDIGACSMRPGSSPATESEEIYRLEEAMPQISESFAALPFSLDTFRPAVARKMLESYSNFSIINDVSGGCTEIYELCAEKSVAYILTWPEGGTVDQMLYFFSKKLDEIFRIGVKDVILDPGFGFGKDVQNNYLIASNLKVLDEFNLPVLAGISRKRMIWQLLGIKPEDSLNATTALNCFLLERGADILRVHDAHAAAEAIAIYKQFKINA